MASDANPADVQLQAMKERQQRNGLVTPSGAATTLPLVSPQLQQLNTQVPQRSLSGQNFQSVLTGPGGQMQGQQAPGQRPPMPSMKNLEVWPDGHIEKAIDQLSAKATVSCHLPAHPRRSPWDRFESVNSEYSC
jgi:hypothetical protein